MAPPRHAVPRWLRARRTRARRIVVSLLLTVGMPWPAGAQSANVQTVKAGFIYNFMKFTQWPGVREGDPAPLHLCTPGPPPLDGQLALIQGRVSGSRRIDVRAHVPSTEWRSCHVVFLAGDDASLVEAVLRTLDHAPVLTLGDLPGFVQSGGMIGLKMETDQVRFEANLGAAQRAGLTLNSQMLKLASRVIR